MNPTGKQKILALVNALISEGEALVATQKPNQSPWPDRVDIQLWSRFRSNCRHLLQILGDKAEPWRSEFNPTENFVGEAKIMLGAVQSIKDAINHDLLVTIEGSAVRQRKSAGCIQYPRESLPADRSHSLPSAALREGKGLCPATFFTFGI
jgi:hypothetical protein